MVPKVKNYTIKKMIKLTPNQNRNWNPKQIRGFLDGNNATNNTETNLFYRTLLKKMIPEFILHEIKIDLEIEEGNLIKELKGEIDNAIV